jgi:hypothetical protein
VRIFIKGERTYSADGGRDAAGGGLTFAGDGNGGAFAVEDIGERKDKRMSPT